MGVVDVVEPVIDEYVAALERELSGPGRVRRELVAEARTHLFDATEAYESTGWDQRSAAERAVHDFGPVKRIAEGYQSVLAVAASRRCAVTLLALLLPQNFLWHNGFRLAPSPSSGDFGLASFLQFTIEWFGFIALALALAAVVITGIGQRWIRAGSWLPRWTGRSVAASAIGTAVLGISLLALDGTASALMWALMITLMVFPMAWALHAARQCLRTV